MPEEDWPKETEMMMLPFLGAGFNSRLGVDRKKLFWGRGIELDLLEEERGAPAPEEDSADPP